MTRRLRFVLLLAIFIGGYASRFAPAERLRRVDGNYRLGGYRHLFGLYVLGLLARRRTPSEPRFRSHRRFA